MELLFRRAQTSGTWGRVNFKLWGKVEFDEDEQGIVKRYRFDQAMLIEAIQPNLLRKAVFVFFGVFLLTFGIFGAAANWAAGIILGAVCGGGVGYWYLHSKRETIYVRDLIHGRNFTCDSVVELARKEAWLHRVIAYLRQVMESAKHWDGVERHTVEALPKDEAREVILRGL